MIFKKLSPGKYKNEKYYIFRYSLKPFWWSLYELNDLGIIDVDCGIFKSLKQAINGAELLDRYDQIAKAQRKVNVMKSKRIRLPNDWMTR